MESKVESILNSIWDQSISAQDEEKTLKMLYKICFKDPLKQDQISNYILKTYFFFSLHLLKVD